jgi:carbon storage regulator
MREICMLVLTRRVGESVIVGQSATFTLLRVRGNRIRVGINAPKEIAIHREEVYERDNRVSTVTDSFGADASSGKSSFDQRQLYCVIIEDILDQFAEHLSRAEPASPSPAGRYERAMDRITETVENMVAQLFTKLGNDVSSSFTCSEGAFEGAPQAGEFRVHWTRARG